jgi:hypothetical protein
MGNAQDIVAVEAERFMNPNPRAEPLVYNEHRRPDVRSEHPRVEYAITREVVNADVVRLTMGFGARLGLYHIHEFTTVTLHDRKDLGRDIGYLIDTFESMTEEFYMETTVYRYFREHSSEHKNFIVDSQLWSIINQEYKHPNEGNRGIRGTIGVAPILQTTLDIAWVSFNNNVLPIITELLCITGDAELIVASPDPTIPILYNGGEYAITLERLLSDFPVIDVTVKQRGNGVVCEKSLLRREFIEKVTPILFEYGFILDSCLK